MKTGSYEHRINEACNEYYGAVDRIRELEPVLEELAALKLALKFLDGEEFSSDFFSNIYGQIEEEIFRLEKKVG